MNAFTVAKRALPRVLPPPLPAPLPPPACSLFDFGLSLYSDANTRRRLCIVVKHTVSALTSGNFVGVRLDEEGAGQGV